jgi:hypothetical protein
MSPSELIVRYLAERARPIVFVPLAVALALVGARSTPRSFAIAALEALLLILAFRIWDDLEDRPRDAIEHPERVTVVAPHIWPLVLLAIVFAVGGLIAANMLPVVVIAIVLLAWYRLRPTSTGVMSGHVVLLKYPAIALAVAPVAPPAAVLVSLYLLLCVVECFDDPALRASLVARRIAFAELALIPLIISASFLGGRPL